jgi:hypothetical protein
LGRHLADEVRRDGESRSDAVRDSERANPVDGGPLMVGATDRKNPYTQRAIERAIKAALGAGLRVTGVRPDGTVLTGTGENGAAVGGAALTTKPTLRDAREKLGVN